MEVPTYIRSHQTVVDFFGRWLSFHDANVLDYELEAESESLSFTLHTWLMTDEVDAKGYFVLRNLALVSFRFSGLHDVKMDAFRSGNILFGLEISPCSDSDLFHVELDSVMDMSGSFSARSGEVISVIPCTSDGKAALHITGAYASYAGQFALRISGWRESAAAWLSSWSLGVSSRHP